MNIIIPIFNPFEIKVKCEPCLVVSLMMFIHHKKAVIVKVIENMMRFIFKLFVNPHKI